MVKYALFALTGLLLLYMAFSGQNLAEVWTTVRGADFRWALPVLLVSVAGNYIRAWRWVMLIRPLGYRCSIHQAFHAVAFGYMVNYAIPRLGEVSRCAALNKTSGLPFQAGFGTVVMERLVDVASLGLLLLFCLWYEHARLLSLYTQHLQPVFSGLLLTGQATFILALAGLLVVILLAGLLLFVQRYLIKYNGVSRIRAFARQMWQGIVSIAQVKNKPLFVLLTLLLWFCYFLTTWLWFFAFAETASLPVAAGLFLMVVGSAGKTLPIQGGGLGAFHFLVAKSLLLYGVAEVYGNSLAIIVHGTQTFYHLMLGGIAAIWIGLHAGSYQKKQYPVK